MLQKHKVILERNLLRAELDLTRKLQESTEAVKLRNIADISNKRKKIKKSNISAIFFIKLIELLVCNQ